MEKNSGFATKQIHTGKIEIPGIAPLATPIFQTSTFEFETTAQGAHAPQSSSTSLRKSGRSTISPSRSPRNP